jgi:hypothetical protein
MAAGRCEIHARVYAGKAAFICRSGSDRAAIDLGGTADSVGIGQVPCHIIATTRATVAACGVPRFILLDRQSILTCKNLSHKIDHKKSRAFKSVYNSFNVTMMRILSIAIIGMCPSQGFMTNPR